MGHSIQTFIPSNLPSPLGPYSHIAKAGQLITISAVAGMDPVTGELVGADAYSQAKQILILCADMLATVEADFANVVHVNLYLKKIEHLDEVTRAYEETVGATRPSGTVVGVPDLPKPGALVTMSLTAISLIPGK
ncbi:MAG TPA: Rid family hydrolase [Pyrinomonadaceae bacterium]|nr:Rid family hydrolase [Pyrinomonadaceae bacterium]